LDKWLNNHIWPLEKESIDPDFIYKETRKAILEMERNGIRAFSDMYFFEEEVARAAEELGIYAVIGEAILDFPTPNAQSPEEALEKTERLIDKYKNSRFVSIAVAPHSIYALSEKYLIKAKDLSRKYDTVLHIHAAETKKEFDDCQKKNDLTPIGYLDKLGLLDEKSVLAHCIWITDKDIDILAERKAHVVHCPLSNLKLGSGIAPIAKLLERGVNVALGTDSAASSNRLDIWEAGKIAALLQKGVNHDPTLLGSREAVKMMTIKGLKALGIDKIDGKKISEIEKIIDAKDNYNFIYHLSSLELS
jgi:5-methylthioadenosine/S-adenosylhomocysteine deaminase